MVVVAAFAATAAGCRRDQSYAAADEIGCKRRQRIHLGLRSAAFNCNVLALDMTDSLQALEKGDGVVLVINISGFECPATRSTGNDSAAPMPS
jgi:hypothetical protein